eukprot:2982118-Prymnesium_polylepis.1
MRNVHQVRERYGNGCQTEEGLTVQPRQGSVVLFYSLRCARARSLMRGGADGREENLALGAEGKEARPRAEEMRHA